MRDNLVSLVLDLRVLPHALQKAVFDLTDSTRDAAHGAHRVLEKITDHRMCGAVIVQCAQIIPENSICLTAIEVICIDDGERGLDYIFGAKECMNCSPRLCPALGGLDLVCSKKRLMGLEHILCVHVPCNPVKKSLPEVLLNVRSDDEDDFSVA